MARVPILLGRQQGEAFSPAVSIERLLNGYLEQTPQGRAPTPVYGTPGLIRLGTQANCRGLLETGEILYAVVGTFLRRIDSAGGAYDIGTIPNAGVTADMAGDGTHVVVVDPTDGEIYVWDGATFGNVTDADAPAASSVEWMNGFFIFTEEDSEQFFISPMNDPTGDYAALDFDSSDIRPDKLVRVRRVGRTLLLMGRQSVEFWFYSGDAIFPFERYADDPLDVGLAGMRCEATNNETIFWLANDLTVRRLDGRTATRISTFAIEQEIAGWSDPSATVVTSHVWRGHLFVVFRNADGCVVWDQATQTWHERQSYDMDTWRAAHYAYCYGKHIFGGPRLYEMDADTYEEDGETLTFEMVTPWLDHQGQRFSITELEVRVEGGVGSLELDPQMTCERTVDGEEYTAPMIRKMGKVGERLRLVRFGRQGMSRGCAFRFRITDAVKRVVYEINAEAS